MPELNVGAEIETPTGWLALEDLAGGYELHTDSFAARQIQARKIEAEGDWVEGSYTVRAVRGNVTEAVGVYVHGADPYQLAVRLQALTDGLEQLQYRFRFTIGNLRESWVCQYGEYNIEANQPLRLATLAIVRCTIPRLPTLVYELVP